jgi:hypothetical protein
MTLPDVKMTSTKMIKVLSMAPMVETLAEVRKMREIIAEGSSHQLN